MEIDENVQLYGAVMAEDKTLINVGDYVAFRHNDYSEVQIIADYLTHSFVISASVLSTQVLHSNCSRIQSLHCAVLSPTTKLWQSCIE